MGYAKCHAGTELVRVRAPETVSDCDFELMAVSTGGTGRITCRSPRNWRRRGSSLAGAVVSSSTNRGPRSEIEARFVRKCQPTNRLRRRSFHRREIRYEKIEESNNQPVLLFGVRVCVCRCVCVCVCMCVGGLAEKSAAVSSRPGVFESGFCVVGLASAGLGRRVLYSGLRRCHCRTAWRGLVIMSCQCFVSEAPVLFLPARKTKKKKRVNTTDIGSQKWQRRFVPTVALEQPNRQVQRLFFLKQIFFKTNYQAII